MLADRGMLAIVDRDSVYLPRLCSNAKRSIAVGILRFESQGSPEVSLSPLEISRPGRFMFHHLIVICGSGHMDKATTT